MNQRLKKLISEYETLKCTAKHDDISDLNDSIKVAFLTKCRAAIDSSCDQGSAYRKQKDEIIQYGGHPGYTIAHLIGVIQSLISDIDSGYMVTFRETIHAEQFSDYLEMAKHLLDNGYKDPAAVIAGSSLEIHLKNIFSKNNISTLCDDGVTHKKADLINSELVKASVYGKLEQKSITAWLDLRNKAAHGNYGQYDINQVGLLIDSIRHFIIKYPA
jgi:hypothetical protein